MELSKLVFECVKNVKYLDDTYFTYQGFINGEFDSVNDYANSINNVFTPLNTAIHRLSDRNKIKNKIKLVGNPDRNNILDISSFVKDIKKILNVFSMQNQDYNRYGFRELGEGKLHIQNYNQYSREVLYVEYIQDIPNFTREDFYFEGETLHDVDLKDYGLSETMCSYIIEYVKGHLLEPIAPEQANAHRIYAEQYFGDLEDQQTPFHQQRIKNVHRII